MEEKEKTKAQKKNAELAKIRANKSKGQSSSARGRIKITIR